MTNAESLLVAEVHGRRRRKPPCSQICGSPAQPLLITMAVLSLR